LPSINAEESIAARVRGKLAYNEAYSAKETPLYPLAVPKTAEEEADFEQASSLGNRK
jgi:hypothetical protein